VTRCRFLLIPPQAKPTSPYQPRALQGRQRHRRADADGLELPVFGQSPCAVIPRGHRCLAPGMHSRYVEPFVVTAMSGPALIDGLLLLRARLNVTPLLVSDNRHQVRTISEHRHRLEGAFYIRLPERDCIPPIYCTN